MLAVDLKVTGY